MVTVSALPLLDALPRSAALHDVRSGKRLDRQSLAARVMEQRDAIEQQGWSERGFVVVGESGAIDTLVGLFAAWAAGHPVVLVNPKLAAEECANVAAATGAVGWIGPGGENATLSTGAASTSSEARALGRDEPALVLMTSGTTGVPKGIVLTLRALEARLHLNLAHVEAAPSALAQSLCVLPLFFGHGLIGNTLTPLMAGGTAHLMPSPDMAETAGLAALIEREGITFMSSVPTFWKSALRLSPKPDRALSRVHIGSAPLGLELWEQVADWCGTRAVYNMLGMSETANWIAGGSLCDARESDVADGHVGRAWGGRLAVLSDGGVADQGRGEVLVQTPSVMTHYLNAPDLTADAFHGPWLRTGDVGELTGGSLRLVGRIKTEINRGGIKILAEEVDMLLERHEDVAEACAFGIPDPAAGEAVAAAIVPREGVSLDGAALKAWCVERVRRDAVPARLFVVDAIPRNDRGKVVRADVRAHVMGDAS